MRDDGAIADVFRRMASDADLERLRGRLAERAVERSLVDVVYELYDSPVGRLLCAATDRGIVRMAYLGERHSDVLQTLSDRLSPRILRGSGHLDDVFRQLDEYFEGARHRFDVALDLRLASKYAQAVLRALADVPYGRTETYAGLAESSAGTSRNARAVGNACAGNPLPVLLPCHRIVRSDGDLGGYVGGRAAKEALLTLERSSVS